MLISISKRTAAPLTAAKRLSVWSRTFHESPNTPLASTSSDANDSQAVQARRPRQPKRKPSPPPSLQHDLPRSALRGIFGLHSQAKDFITPETLDDAIHKAFTKANSIDSPQTRVEKRIEEFAMDVELRRSKSKARLLPAADKHMQQVLPSTEVDPEYTYTAERSIQPLGGRTLAIKAALYGGEPNGSDIVAGLEVVEELEREQASSKP